MLCTVHGPVTVQNHFVLSLREHKEFTPERTATKCWYGKSQGPLHSGYGSRKGETGESIYVSLRVLVSIAIFFFLARLYQ